MRVPWTARRSNQSFLKEINPKYSLEGLMLKLKLQYFGHLMWRTDSLEKTLMLGKVKAQGEGGDQGWDGWIASPTQWTWTWANSRRQWRTRKPGMLQSMEWQRVRDDLVTEQQFWSMVTKATVFTRGEEYFHFCYPSDQAFTTPFLLEELTQSYDPDNSQEIHFWVYQMALTSLGRRETFMKQVHRKGNLICCYNFLWFSKASLKRWRPWFHWDLYAHLGNAREREKGDRGPLPELSLKSHLYIYKHWTWWPNWGHQLTQSQMDLLVTLLNYSSNRIHGWNY